jgi:hypothetical protein
MDLKSDPQYPWREYGMKLEFSTPKEEVMHSTLSPFKASTLIGSLLLAIVGLLQPGMHQPARLLRRFKPADKKCVYYLTIWNSKGLSIWMIDAINC